MTNWLDNVVALNVKPTTLQTYRPNAQKQIFPRIGDIKVQDLTPALLDKWLRDLQAAGLSFRYIDGCHALVRQALDYAVYPAQLINSNPASYIKSPKNAPRKIIKRHIISPEQFNTLLEKFPFGTPFYIPLLLLYHTGMRLGEVLGLTWADVNFAEKKLHVNRQLVYLHKRGYFLTALKTESSKRYIIIDSYLLGELRRWKEQQITNEQEHGGAYVYTYLEDDGQITRQSKALPYAGQRIQFICSQPNGKLLLKTTLITRLTAEGLNALSFRHTHATQLIEVGAAPEGVSVYLGHKNLNSTFKVYVHNTPKVKEQTYKLQKETLEIFNKILSI